MKKNVILLVTMLVLAALAWFVYKKNSPSTLTNQPLAEFAIEDTASVTKIFITNGKGNSVLVERVPGQTLWKLNNHLLARRDAVNLLLDTFKRIKVRGSLSEKASENMLRVLASSGKKVEIYQGGDKPSKIYYVGTSTPDHMGTIMLLEIPGVGRSEIPYITHMEGFTGFLTPRFFTDENEWRYTGYYEFPQLELSKIQLIDNYNPNSSFAIEYKGGNDIRLWGGYQPALETYNTSIAVFDTLAVKDYMLAFKKVHFDSYNTLLKPEAMDSIDKVLPAFTIKVTDNKSKTKSLNIYLKRAAKAHYDEAGNIIPWDMEYLWAKTESDEYALAQRFVFNPILIPIESFLMKK
jgi:hypothetical protein